MAMTKTDLYDFLASCRLGVVGTIGSDNRPESSLLGIATSDKLEIIFDTLNSTRKYRNLIARPACSFAIGWTGEQTVQYEGEAKELRGSELGHFQEIYFGAWPECRSHLSWTGITYFLVRPRWIRFSDFDQRPPFIREFLEQDLRA
jgi:uncharacterized pyridoxamine 5'-phosphate oxidase family protein